MDMEDEALGLDEACAEALARGFARFVKFPDASKLDATAFASRGSRQCACSSQEIDESFHGKDA